MRGALIVLLSAAGCAATVAADPPAPAPDPSRDASLPIDAGTGETSVSDAAAPHDLRVLTINLWNPVLNSADADARMSMIADFIEANAPDFVSVQEATTGPNRAEQIATLAGYDFRWKAGMSGLFEEGPAALSRTPIVWSATRALPHKDLLGQMTRQVVAIRAQTKIGEVTFYATHTFVTPDDDKKKDQAVAIDAFMAEHASPSPKFLAGDLNAVPTSPAMTFLATKLADAWTEAEPGDPGLTSPADAPTERIDYVWSTAGAKAVDCRLVLTAAQSGVRASDHFGVMCDFVL
jgi:endonuclease/exonuclease/phosphatase family metal-dependent hydrolase